MLVVSFGSRRFWRRLGLILFALLAADIFWEPLQAVQVAGSRKIRPIYQVETSEQKVAFSFDACWGAEYTGLILDILDRHQVQTTFFLVNTWLEKYPDKAREIAEHDHEIGLHSATHPHFTQLSPEKMQQELEENARLIREITGYQPRLFRPPFGDYNDTVIQTAQALGFQPVQWSIDSLDWQDRSADEIYRRVTSRLEPGAIVLFHNNGKYTAQVLGNILDYAISAGYTVVPVSDLLLTGDYYIDVNGIQRPGPGP